MIIDCISDLHGLKPALAGGDLLIIAGDLTARDTLTEHSDTLNWLHKQDYKKKVLIAGNHDHLLERNPNFYKETNVDYLCDSGTEFQGLRIWGSPWSLWFQGINPACTAFTGNETRLRESYALIPPETDILITHMPPRAILDSIDRGGVGCSSAKIIEHVGSEALYDRLCDIRPRLHVFGHIHENGGNKLVMKRAGFGVENNTTCVNASIMNEHYKPTNKPMRVIL